MKNIKLYDMILPFWLILFFPPLIFASLAANFVIDSAVLLLCCMIFRIHQGGKRGLWQFYRHNILQVWGFGFLSDLFGVVFIFIEYAISSIVAVHLLNDAAMTDLNEEILLNIFSVIGMLFASVSIYLLNMYCVFKRKIPDKTKRLKLSLTIAVVTTPWTFLIQQMPNWH